MGVKVKVKIDGLREVQAALSRLKKSTERKIIEAVLMRRAEPIAEMARRLAPVDTGDLHDSIVVSNRLTKRERAKARKLGRREVNVYVGANVPHAHLQEFGTAHHPAQPFMRPAWDANKEKALEGIVDDLWAEIRKALRRT